MIPIQTLLALLAALVLMSCSQEPPHKSEIDKLTRQAATNASTAVGTGNGNPSPTNAPPVTVNPDPTINVKPDQNTAEPVLDPETSLLTIDGSDATELKFKFTGLDAQRLFALLEVEPQLKKIRHGSLQSETEESEALDKAFLKAGQHVQCTQNGLSVYDCTLSVQIIDGDVLELQDPKKIKSKPGYALYHPQKQIVGTFFSFDANLPGKDKDGKDKPVTPYFQLNLYNQNAKQIFDTLKVGEVEGRKKGKRVNCLRDLKLEPSDLKAYSCIFYGNLSTGSFEEIQ